MIACKNERIRDMKERMKKRTREKKKETSIVSSKIKTNACKTD